MNLIVELFGKHCAVWKELRSTGVGMSGGLGEGLFISVIIIGLIIEGLFKSNKRLRVVLDRSLSKNIQLMLVFLKTSFYVML